jgi:ferric-dicitrate binding protein FerR (iron transport regulator)
VSFITKNRPIPRRQAICLIGGGSFAFAASGAMAASGVGTVVQINGPGQVGRPDRLAAMQAGMDIFAGDLAVTGNEGRAHLGLGTATQIHLGPQSQLQIDAFIADIGGEIFLDGALIFDRDDGAPKVDMNFQTDFGRIGVRGTRFFAGPSDNAFAVFVERGVVEISGGGVRRSLNAGQGAELRGKDAAPGPVGNWSEARIKAAFDWVLGG